MKSKAMRCLLLALAATTLASAEQTWTLALEHTWANDEQHWTPRGEVHIFQSLVDHTLIGRYVDVGATIDRDAIASVAGNDGTYRIRCASNVDRGDGEYVMGHTTAHRQAQSNLQEVLLVSVDTQRRRLLSITPLPIVMNYDALYTALAQELTATSFNTSVRVIDLIDGPSPDTASYIARLEQEARAKTDSGGGEADNRSFIMKYWMYIVPVVIFMLVSGAMGDGGAA